MLEKYPYYAEIRNAVAEANKARRDWLASKQVHLVEEVG